METLEIFVDLVQRLAIHALCRRWACLEAPKPRWVAPRLTGINAPRPAPAPAGIVAPRRSGLHLARRARPPVPAHIRQLTPLRTVILRL